jgi:nitroreductase
MTVTTGITQDLFRDAVAAAIRAPSVYNVQPWKFALRDGAIEVRIDPDRALPVADPHGWAARIACGAALTNIELSLTVAGMATDTKLWPAPGDHLWVATLTATGPAIPTPANRALHAAIDHRYSNRRPFFDTPVPADIRARLRDAANATSAWLALVADREPVARIAEIVHIADDLLRRDSAYVAEMNAWLGHYDGAGIPAEAAGIAPGGQDLLAMRDFGGHTRAEGRDFESDPLLVVVGTDGDSQLHQVVAGMALQRLLLTATEQRLASSMLSQPIEVPAAREDLRQALRRHGTPQMIVRIGYGQPGRATTRRPVDSVIDIAG